MLTGKPLHTLKGIFAGMLSVFGKSHYSKQRYVSTLKMMFELLDKVRRAGMLSIEIDIEKPEESEIFKQYPEFIADHHIRDFVCDTVRMAVTGGVDPFDLDQMMELDMEVQHRCGSHQPVSALTTVADSLPGLGIVAAVLSASSLPWARSEASGGDRPQSRSALVGTFLGILLCYGLVGPIGSYMGKEAEEEHAFLYMLRVLMVSFCG